MSLHLYEEDVNQPKKSSFPREWCSIGASYGIWATFAEMVDRVKV